MRNLPALTTVVQRNCDISDARHAGDYGLCTFLLKMREYYRWEHELPLTRNLPQDELGDCPLPAARPLLRVRAFHVFRMSRLHPLLH